MDNIQCYSCKGIFGIEEQYRKVKRMVLKRKKNHIAESYVKTKMKTGIVCPYCHSHLFEKLLKPN